MRINQKNEAIKLLERQTEQDSLDNKFNSKISLSLANMYLAEHQNKAIVEYERLIKFTPPIMLWH